MIRMCEECKEYKEYKSFDELPEELKEKFKNGSVGGSFVLAKNGYIDFINQLNQRGDELVGDYVSATSKTQIRFGKCRHTADISPSKYKSGHGCGVCSGWQVQRGVNDLATLQPSLAKEWHPIKNGGLMPYEVTQSSNKKVWWQCEKGHEWETSVTHRTNMGSNCPYCSNYKVLKGYNDIATTHPHLIEYFNDIEDAYTYTYSSDKKAELECPNCGHVKTMKISNLTYQGFSCNICSDGIPFSEKLMTLILTKLNIEFVKQMSFDNGEHRYDFYLPQYNVILETHGEQHYRGWCGNEEDFLYQQENDGYKRELAIVNGILNEDYHEIDCRHSTLEWCRLNVEKALSKYVDTSLLTDEDWKQADIQAQKSLKIEVCKHWKENKEVNSELTIQQVAEVFGVSNNTVGNYLKWGNANGLCVYETDGRGIPNLVYLIKQDGKTKWFDEPINLKEMERQTGISATAIKNNLDKGALKYHRNSKYDTKYTGSYIVSADKLEEFYKNFQSKS